MYNQICKLISEEISYDSQGNRTATPVEREVFCQSRGVYQSEFYNAARVDMKPSVTLVLSDDRDYDGEKIVEFDDKTYDVIRTYPRDGSLELTLQAREKS